MRAFIAGAALGAAIGYTKGAKAGKQRYQQIRQQTERLASTPIGQRVFAVKNRGADEAEGVMTKVMNRAAGINRKGEKV